MSGAVKSGHGVLASNRRASHEYALIETFEAGLELTGPEVKSARAGHVALADGYVRVEGGEAWLFSVHITPYEQGNRANPEPDRKRKLLLHRKEIDYLQIKVKQGGFALIPLKLFTQRNKIKLEFALGKGKKLWDKRADIAKRDVERDTDREIAKFERG